MLAQTQQCLDFDPDWNMGIYLILSPSGRIYIGQSSNLKKRHYEHKRTLLNGNHSNIRLQRSFDKHGKLFFLVIEYVTEKEKLTEREQYWMEHFDVFNKGMNLTTAADSTLGSKRSDKTRNKISKNSSKFWSKEENRKAQSDRKKKFINENPDFKLILSENTKKAQEKNPEIMKRHAELMRVRGNSPEEKAKFVSRMKQYRNSLTEDQKRELAYKSKETLGPEGLRLSAAKGTLYKLKAFQQYNPQWGSFKSKGGIFWFAVARWTEPKSGKNITKKFSVLKYGLIQAHYLAAKLRMEQQERLIKEVIEHCENLEREYEKIRLTR